jgi:pilus assembly protein FimV
MRTSNIRKTLFVLAVAALAFGASPAARAIGLGPIHSRSRIGEYFTATIPVLGVRPSDLRGLRVRLASRRRFAALGLVKSSVLYGLEFRVLPVAHHRHEGVIVIRSLRPLRVPFLSFVLRVRWPSGALLRSYTVLLRPPLSLTSAARPSPPAAVSPAPPAPVPAPAAPPPARRSPPSPLPALRHVYGPVRPGQSLWGIARRLRPPGVSTDRMMEALYRSNPHAFIGNINLLRSGYVLRVPSARAIAAVGRRQAVDFVLREDRAWARTRAAAPRRPLELLTPTVVAPRTIAPAEVIRLRHRLQALRSRLARTQAALARARKTIAALHHRLVVPNAEAAALAHKPPARPVRPPLTHPRPHPAPSFPWVPVLLVLFLLLLVVALLLRRRASRSERSQGPIASRAAVEAVPAAPAPSPEDRPFGDGFSAGGDLFPSGPSPEHGPQGPQPASSPTPKASPPASSPRVALLAEVDFSLAYGLQDQAIESLRAYLEQNPGDEEVHAKLVEVYANSRDAEAFLAAAAAHRASFGTESHAADIARWAESLGVSERLNAGLPPPEDTHARGVADVGTVFDEVLAASDTEPLGTKSLDDSEMLPREATIGTATETALEFDIDLAAFETPSPSPPASVANTPGSDDTTQSQFEESLRALRDTATGTVTGTGEIAFAGATATDTVATKLSLIRAYLDMGDRDGARGLLDEVLKEGTAEQRAEAERLLQRLRD